MVRKKMVSSLLGLSLSLSSALVSTSAQANCIDRYRTAFKANRNWSAATLTGTTLMGILLPITLVATIPAGVAGIARMSKKGLANRDIYFALKDASDHMQSGQSDGRFNSFYSTMAAARRVYQLGTWDRTKFVQELMKANDKDLFCQPDRYNPKLVHLASRTDVIALMVYTELRRQDMNTINVGSVKQSDDYKRMKARIKASATTSSNYQGAAQYDNRGGDFGYSY